MKEAFRSKLGMNKANEERFQVINDIIEEYQAQGYRLTLRQLYYQLVSRDIIANQLREYSKLSDLLVKGRMAGIVDWEAIEDRVRVPYLPYYADDIHDALSDLINQYRLDRQEGQDNYIEAWVEKDALSGVLKRVTQKYHVRLMVNRGYSSATAMHDAYKRIAAAEGRGQVGHILYLGDHDPSGLDMVRDIRERLEEFGVNPVVQPIALTDAQIKKYNPPPNPAKLKDPRATWYVDKYGYTSWEVDALRPDVLNKLVSDSIEDLIDLEQFNAVLDQEEKDKEKLRNVK